MGFPYSQTLRNASRVYSAQGPTRLIGPGRSTAASAAVIWLGFGKHTLKKHGR